MPDMGLSRQNVRKKFTYSPPSPARAELHDKVNEATADLAELYFKVCVIPSPELTLAVRALQQARMWVNTALSQYDPTAEVAGPARE